MRLAALLEVEVRAFAASQTWGFVTCEVCSLWKKCPFTFVLSQHLKLPRCLVFVIQTVRVEIELPRWSCLVLIVQAVRGAAEAEARRSVRRRGEGGGRAQVAGRAVAAHGAHSGARELVVHRRQVGAAVHAGEVGRGARVALVVARRLRVGHGVGALHAGGGGGGERVGERGDGGRAPDRHRRRAAAHSRERGAGGRRKLAAGSALGAGLSERGALLLHRPAHGFILHSTLGLLGLLAMLGPSVLEPHLKRQRALELVKSSFSKTCLFLYFFQYTF